MALAETVPAPLLDRACTIAGLPPSVPGILSATPSLRLPWLGGAAGVSLVAALASSSSEQALVFLLVAPVVPVAAVAGAYGPWADTMFELQRSTPLSGLHVLLVRTLAVLGVSLVALGIVVPVLPDTTFGAWAWVLPALALSLSSLALSTSASIVRAAVIVVMLWCVGVAVAAAAGELGTLFGGVGQVGFLLLAVAASLMIARRRERFEIEDRRARRALVDAADTERRRIERNIHDGAQQQLVAIGVKAGLARTFVTKDPHRAIAIIDELRAEAQEALDGLREMTRGGYPPVLADEGLEAAIALKARHSPVPVSVEAGGVGRMPKPVEVAAFFCCLEAIQNAVKYARSTSILVTLRRSGGELAFSVADDGAGFDPPTVRRGIGMRSMAERVESLGGTFDVQSSVGSGTVVSGRLPLGPL